ncbi:MAG: hypothetical protein R3B70_22910 [Polyangiaceae bacterium]
MPDSTQLTELELEYRAELPKILIAADRDLDAALRALDRYLRRAPPLGLKKAILAWKGRFYLEHGRYDEAVRELRAADGLEVQDDLKNFNTKVDLAKALEKAGDTQGAHSVLTAALAETSEPSLLLKLLDLLVQVSVRSRLPLPSGAEMALSRAKQFYGLDQVLSVDLSTDTARLAGLVHDDSVRLTRLHQSLSRAKTPGRRASLVRKYLAGATVPYFKGIAENLLRREQDAATKDK